MSYIYDFKNVNGGLAQVYIVSCEGGDEISVSNYTGVGVSDLKPWVNPDFCKFAESRGNSPGVETQNIKEELANAAREFDWRVAQIYKAHGFKQAE